MNVGSHAFSDREIFNNDKWIVIWTMRPDHMGHKECDYCELQEDGTYLIGDDADLWIDDFATFDSEADAKSYYDHQPTQEGYDLWRIAYARMIEWDNIF